LSGQTAGLCILITVKVFLNGFGGSTMLVCQLFKGLFAEDIFLKQTSLPLPGPVLPDKLSAALLA
jgi:hypothetical protein